MDAKKFFISLLSIFLGIGVFFLTLLHFGIRNIMSAFSSMYFFYLFLFFLVTTLILLLSVYRWKLIINSFGYDISFLHLFSYDVMAYAVSYITPSARSGGFPLMVYFLKKEKITLAESVSSVTIDRALDFIVNISFAVFAAFVFIFLMHLAYVLKILSIIFSLVFLVFFLSFFLTLYFRKGFFSTVLGIFNFIPRFNFITLLRRKVRKLELYIHFFLRYRLRSLMKCSILFYEYLHLVLNNGCCEPFWTGSDTRKSWYFGGRPGFFVLFVGNKYLFGYSFCPSCQA